MERFEGIVSFIVTSHPHGVHFSCMLRVVASFSGLPDYVRSIFTARMQSRSGYAYEMGIFITCGFAIYKHTHEFMPIII